LLFGVLHGSVPGPILFLLYTAELFDIIAECSFTCHTYADDTQVVTCVSSLSTPACDHIDAMERLASCIERIRGWMADCHLKLNKEKTQIIWLGTRQQLNKLSTQALTLPNSTVQFSTAVKGLGVILDCQLTLANHVAALSCSCFFYIRQLKSFKQSLTPEAMMTLVYAFTSS